MAASEGKQHTDEDLHCTLSRRHEPLRDRCRQVHLERRVFLCTPQLTHSHSAQPASELTLMKTRNTNNDNRQAVNADCGDCKCQPASHQSAQMSCVSSQVPVAAAAAACWRDMHPRLAGRLRQGRIAAHKLKAAATHRGARRRTPSSGTCRTRRWPLHTARHSSTSPHMCQSTARLDPSAPSPATRTPIHRHACIINGGLVQDV